MKEAFLFSLKPFLSFRKKPFSFLLEREKKNPSGKKKKRKGKKGIIEIDELLAIHQCDEL